MLRPPSFRKHELPVVFELLHTLQEVPDVNLALAVAYPLIKKLVPSDHGAMCISRRDKPALYDWTVAEMSPSFFRDYAELAKFDFVGQAVGRRPNLVLSDVEILPLPERVDIERHPLYQYARSQHMPIEQILAVKMSTDPTWNGGLTLYRDKPRAYTAHEQQILQFLTQYLAAAMGARRHYGEAILHSKLIDSAFDLERTSVLVFSSDFRWIGGTSAADLAFKRCFGPKSCGADGLPRELSDKIKDLSRQILPMAPILPWVPSRPGAGAVVSFVPSVKESGTRWYVFLDEAPDDWRAKLTPAELDVAVRAAQGWDNDVIAQDRSLVSGKPCSPNTIRTQINSIYIKLGIERREMLAARFRERC